MITPNEKLRRARLEKRWSVSTASRRVEVSRNTFNRWERGLQIPQLATLDQLCTAFELSAEDLGFGSVVSLQKKIFSKFLIVEDVNEVNAVISSSEVLERSDVNPMSVEALIEYPRLPHVQLVSVASNTHEPMSRRQVIATLISTTAATFDAQRRANSSLLRVEEILTLCAAHIPLCWQLYFEGGLVDVERMLPTYVAQLVALVEEPSSYQKRAAALLSQAYQLASLLSAQHQNYGAAHTYAQQGLHYGEMAEDPGLQVASIIRHAMVYFYLKHPRLRYRTYQKALQLAPQTSPLLQGRVYMGIAEACSLLDQEDNAWRVLDTARKTFPAQAEDDPNFAFTHFTINTVATFEGWMHLNLNQPAEAWNAFARLDLAVPRESVPNRLELTVYQGMASCALGELEQTCDLLERAVPMAYVLESQLRLDGCYEIYGRMLAKWGEEPVVQDLEALFKAQCRDNSLTEKK